jgi:mRNA interferase RelE/StbE
MPFWEYQGSFLIFIDSHQLSSYNRNRKAVFSMLIKYSKIAAKSISKLDSTTKKRLKVAIEGLTESPARGDIKPLQGSKTNCYRLRVGKYRVIYRFDTELNQSVILFIEDIDSRGGIYK